MIDFEIWLKIGHFHLTATPENFALIHIKNGIFRYLIEWQKTEKKPKPEPEPEPIINDDDDFDPIPF